MSNKTFQYMQTGAASTPLTFIQDRLYFTTLLSAPQARPDVHYFTIDHVLVYQNFYADFGPLNLSSVIRFCDLLKQLLRQPELSTKKIVLYSSVAADKKANALFLICAFMMLVCDYTPEQACQPLASIASTIVPFRDAGYGPDTYHITILDCLKGLNKAIECKLLDLAEFDLEEYEYYEKVHHGDMNWLVRNKFLACATPHDDPPTGSGPNAYPKTAPHPSNENIIPHGEPWRMNDYINYFKQNKVTTVIRLNHKVYDRQRFVEQGIEHIELYFHDGSCPSMEILNAFLEIVESDRRCAVHCKAGLGRTGSLIAAYLMKHYRFTASEIIGFLRIMRPGSVVGPQQNWLYSMQAQLWSMGAQMPVQSAAAAHNVLHAHRSAANASLTSTAAYHSNSYVLRSGAPRPAIPASVSDQANVYETAVPATKTTLVGDQEVAIPVQPRKGSDGSLTPATSFLKAVEQLLITSEDAAIAAPAGPVFSTGAAMMHHTSSASNGGSRYNLRASTVAARSNPTSRSNSLTFDPAFTPRSTSNSSLKIKSAIIKTRSGSQSQARRKETVVV